MPLVVSAIDYTLVISSVISAVGAITAAAVGAWVARQIRTPSGDRLGAVVERTHDLATVSVKTLHHLDGSDEPAADDKPAGGV